MKIFRILLVAALFAVAFIVYPHLPEEVPIHWNTLGEPDDFASRGFGAFLVPLMGLGFLILFPLLAKIDPRKANYKKFTSAWEWIQTLLIMMLAYFYGIQIFITFYPEHQALMPRLMFGGIGLLFIALGNLMGKLRQNFFVGLRTPWTLSDPEVWQKSQRVAGWSFVTGGLLFILLAFWGDIPHIGAIFISITAMMILFPIVYSYLAYSKHKHK